MSSLVGLGGKIGAAVGAAALGVLMSMSGYTGDTATMPSSAMTMIRLLFSIVPACLYVLVAFTLKGYTINKQIGQIREENEARRAERVRDGAGQV